MFSFTLLDDSNASATQPTSRLYTDLQQVLSCTDAAQFSVMLSQMQTALRHGLYAVAVLSYELGAELQCLNLANKRQAQHSHILIYKQCQHLSQEQVTNWLEQQQNSDNDFAGIADLRASVGEEEFSRDIKRIQRYIIDGDTYQVNYTYRLHFQAYGNPFLLYQRLRTRQSVPFGALIFMPDGSAILSLSPELFIRQSQGQLITCPMKGTLGASAMLGDDADAHNLQRCEQLALDEKNRAENVMIVDLLRNDLGRIAQLGSIKVPTLFQVQRFNSVLQMTSSVVATCRDDIELIDILKAVYPCGSITGAPKIRAMQIIHELETEARGIYTGAIGWFDPPAEPATIPEFCLSVPIRTVHLQAATPDGLRRGVMGVGAGIVFDSEAVSEYQECQLKARFLTELPAQFSLFETMYATKEQGCRHWEKHSQRLQKSARYFGVPLDLIEIEKQLKIICAGFAEDTSYRLKLSVDGVGKVQLNYAVLTPLKMPVTMMLATTPQQSDSIWLQHKTSHRADYDLAWKTAELHGAFDMVFCNERGELTEGGRSNLLVKIAGRWYTPPLSTGVLPGVMRSVLMEDPDLQLTERSIHVSQLIDAEQIALCNAVRGMLYAKLFANYYPPISA